VSVQFLSTEQVLAVHARVIAAFGGDRGVRDNALLESAVAMPAATYAGERLHDGVPAMAAAYLYHLCRNRPFVDGNKRTALASAEVFLILNGAELDAANDEVVQLTMDVASGVSSKARVTAFLEARTRIVASPAT